MKIANDCFIDTGFPLGLMKIFWKHIGMVDVQCPMSPEKSKSKSEQ